MDKKPEKLPVKFRFAVNGEERDIFMSFALLNRLSYLTGGAEGVEHLPLIMVDPTIREAVLKELLAERSKTGRVKQEVELEDLELDLETIPDLLDWASAHILDFCLAGLEKSKALQFRNQARLLNLKSIQTGSQD